MTAIIIGEYPYPNHGTFLHKIGNKFFNVSRNQIGRPIPPHRAAKLIAAFFPDFKP